MGFELESVGFFVFLLISLNFFYLILMVEVLFSFFLFFSLSSSSLSVFFSISFNRFLMASPRDEVLDDLFVTDLWVAFPSILSDGNDVPIARCIFVNKRSKRVAVVSLSLELGYDANSGKEVRGKLF